MGKRQREIITKAGDERMIAGYAARLEPLYNNLSWLYDMIAVLCDIQSDNPFTNIELRSSKNDRLENIIIHQDDKLSLQLTLIKPRDAMNQSVLARHYIFSPDMIITTIVKGNDAVYKLAYLDDEVLTEDHSVHPCIDGQYHIYDNRSKSLHISPHHDDVIILRAVIKHSAFQKPDHKSHQYRTYINDNDPIISSADESALHAQFMFTILREAKIEDAIPLFEQWIRNEAPEMRWYVMKEFLALSIKHALPHLTHMAHYDNDTEVRKTALGTMHMLRANYPILFKDNLSCPN